MQYVIPSGYRKAQILLTFWKEAASGKNAGYEIRESVLFDNGRGFAARSADYQRRYGVQEVKRPIAEQMKAAKKQTEKPVDKVREMPPRANSLEREER